MPYTRFCLFGFLAVLVVVVLVVAVADPSVECEVDLMCEGQASVCVNHYCQCQDDFPHGWRCQRRYAGFQYYRGYGSPYSGLILVAILFGACCVCWMYPCGDLPPPQRNKVWIVERGGTHERKLKCAHMI